MIDTILFDKNQTLISIPSWKVLSSACYKAAFPLYVELASKNKVDVNLLAPMIDDAVSQQGLLLKESLREKKVIEIYQDALFSININTSVSWINDLIECEYNAAYNFLRPGPQAKHILQVLSERGYRIGLVSNDIYPVEKALMPLSQFGLLQYFDEYVFSSELGWRKPSPVIFNHILSKLNAEPTSTIMVGDDLKNDIDGAQKVGCWTIQTLEFRQDRSDFIRPHAFISCLEDLLDLIDKWQST